MMPSAQAVMERYDETYDPAVSRKRICGVYDRKPIDRVPIVSPINWGCGADVDAVTFGDWRDEENFRSVARLAQRYCDPYPAYPESGKIPPIWEPVSYQRFLEAPAEYVETLPPVKTGVRTVQTKVLHTPKGDLRWTFANDDGVFTTWDVERPIQCKEDVDKMLSVPYAFKRPDPSALEAFRQRRAELGENAFCGFGFNSMIAMLEAMMPCELLFEWIITEPELLKRLADAWLERVTEKMTFLLDQGVGPFWHSNGVERATPPMMGPRQWADWVVPYDGAIMALIKRRDPQARIHVHCHGKMGTLLDSFVELGADSLDPLEPSPQGDVDLAAAKRKYAGKLVFVGNIEFLDMETRTPDEVEELVRRAIVEGGKENFILHVSAGPHERMTDRFAENAVRYIEAGLKYGRM